MRRIILLSFASCILLLISEFSFAQQNMLVKGVVTEQSTNDPLPGVAIYLGSGTSQKALGVSDNNGRFSVTVPASGGQLILRFIGFADRSVTLKPGQTTVNVKLSEESKFLDQVVIRGYTKRTREETTGSSYVISSKEIQDIPVSSVEQLLQGKVPGLNIQVNTGAPGYRGTVAIRGISGIDVTADGATSFLSPTSPLYVIDGIPIDADTDMDFGYNTTGPGVSPLSLIPPEDIQSIEILKDAQATSLYGSRGAFGVILITTRRGNSKVPRVRYDVKVFANTPPKLRSTLGGRAERQAKVNQILMYGTPEDIIRLGNTPILSDSLNSYYNNSTDWQSVFYRTTINQSHNLGIDGGDDKFNYKANFGYYNENGIMKNTGYDRYNLTMNMDYKPSHKFRVFFNVAGGVGKKSKGSGQGLIQSGVAGGSNASSLLPGPSLFQSSPAVLAALNIDNDNTAKNLRTNAEVSYELFKGLRLTSNGSFDYAVGTEENFTPAAANNMYSEIYSYFDRKSLLYNRNSITYAKTLAGDHNFFANVFNEVFVNDFQASFIKQGRTANDQIQGPLGAKTSESRGGGVLKNYKDEHALSFAGAFSYNYKVKYILDLSYRLDGSSYSGFDNPYAQNSSVGFKWNFHRENLLTDLKWLSAGDIRLTWGKNIRPSSSVFTLYGTYVPSAGYLGNPGISIDHKFIPNNTLKPQTTQQYNLAVDLGFFNNKLELIYETYYKNVFNIQRDVPLPNTTGFELIRSDEAALIDYGHELSLTVRPLSAKSKFNWTLTANGSINNDFLTQLPRNINQIIIESTDVKKPGATVLRVGRNTLSNFLYRTNGVYSNNAEIPVDPVTGLSIRNNSSNTAFFKAGDPKFVDTDGDFVITNRDRQIMGNSQPIFTGGMNTYLSYKNYSINMNASYTVKRDIMNDALAQRLRLMSDPFGSNVLLPLDDVNYWTGPGDNARYPNPFDYTRASVINPFRAEQSLFQEDGSYFKINNVTFNYSLNQSFTKRLGISRARVYFSTNNVVTFSPYSGPNPENVTALGYDVSGGYPVTRTYNIGFNIEL